MHTDRLYSCFISKLLLLGLITTSISTIISKNLFVNAFTAAKRQKRIDFSTLILHPNRIRTTLGSNNGDNGSIISSAETVSDLLGTISNQKKLENEDDTDGKNNLKSKIKDLIEKLLVPTIEEEEIKPSLENVFGLYDVSYVLSARENDNPVGGKWTKKKGLAQKIFRTRRTFQHLLPTNTTGFGLLTYNNNDNNGSKNKETDNTKQQNIPVVAEAVNVISLDAFLGLLRLTVILRGDAVLLSEEERNSSKMVRPLSKLAVRAYFDPPKIILGKSGRFINISIGPSSSVVLDAPYVDDNIRIGKGGTSGTKFVFQRCGSIHDLLNRKLKGTDNEEAIEFLNLLNCPPVKKAKFCSIFGLISALGVYMGFVKKMRIIGYFASFISTLTIGGVLFSSGGIEEDRNLQQA